MGKRALVRIVKTFILSALIVYVLLRAPYLYAQLKFTYTTYMDDSTSTRLTSMPPTPIKLPISNVIRPVGPINRQFSDVATLSIERIGVKTPIVFGVNESDFTAMYNRLNSGVVHYTATPKPGLTGTAIIIGHSSDYLWKRNPYASVFALLNKLVPGDRMTINYSDGTSYRFVMNQAIIYDPKNDDPAKFSDLENTTVPSLLLITCWPINSAAKRYMVQAVLESSG